MSKVIGLSLSLCVKDILDGRVALDDVSHVVTGTSFRSHDELYEIIRFYIMMFWMGHRPAEIHRIISVLLGKGIMQPQLYLCEPPDISAGHWFPLTSDIEPEYRLDERLIKVTLGNLCQFYGKGVCHSCTAFMCLIRNEEFKPRTSPVDSGHPSA